MQFLNIAIRTRYAMRLVLGLGKLFDVTDPAMSHALFTAVCTVRLISCRTPIRAPWSVHPCETRDCSPRPMNQRLLRRTMHSASV